MTKFYQIQRKRKKQFKMEKKENDNNENKTNDRYFTNQEEFQILSDSIGTYNKLPKRSQDRKSFITKIRKKLEKINPNQWDDKKVRVWFTNNEKRFKNDDDNDEPENDTQYPPESPQVPLQQISYIDNNQTMLKTQFIKPQIQPQYEQPQQPIQQPQYELQPPPVQQHIQPRYEQPPPPIQQPQYDQQPPIQQQIHPQQQQHQHPIQRHPIQQQMQPQYEPQQIIQQPQYDHQQTPIPPQYEQQQQQHPIQQPQYEQQQAPIQRQYAQQSPAQQPIQQPQYEQQQTPIQPQYAQQYPAQQPIQPQYEQQLQPVQPQYEQRQQQNDQQQQQQYQQPSQYQQQPSEMYREQSEIQSIQNFPGAEMSQSQYYYPYSTFSTPANSVNSFWQVNMSSLSTSNTTNESKNAEPEPEEAEEENSDDLPSIPEVGDNLSSEQKDELKYKLYDTLRNCYRYFKQIKNYKRHETRLAKQEELEIVFIKVLNLFQEKLGIKDIFSRDTLSLCITTKNINAFSVTTQRYNNLPVDTDAPNNAPTLVEGDPFIYYSKAYIPTRLSPLMSSFYFGKYEQGCRNVIDISNIEAATFIAETGDSICTAFNQSLSSHQIILGQNDAEAPTGFFGKANSMIVHNNNVYIQGDVRVKVFNLSSLECFDTLFIRDEEIKKSAISIWNENIAVGVDNTIYIYSLNPPMACKEDPNFKKKYESISIEMKIDKNSIEWTRGRDRKRISIVDNIKSISSMVTVNDNILVVASEDYPVIYVYGQDESLIARLIGHTMGITSLYTSDDNSFYSGSKDKTIKKWNIKDAISTHHFMMHGSDVTSIATANYNNHLFLFSGSKDSRILVWDVTAKKSTFQIDVTENLYPTNLLFIPSCSTLYIIAQQKDKQGQQINSEDQIQIFTFSK